MRIESLKAQMFTDREQSKRIERQILLLQTGIAFFFCLATPLGLFGNEGLAFNVLIGWIAMYHVIHAWYIVARRMAGKPIAICEAAVPILDISCITAAYIILDNPASPIWGIYLFAYVGYGRRYHGTWYLVLAAYITASVAAARLAVHPHVDSALIIMVVIAIGMASFSHAIGTAWRRAEREARQLAEGDPLTGIANRRVFLQRLEAMSADPAQRYAILMLDLDDFKLINDMHGHQHGDQVLIDVVRILAEHMRVTDLLARYGGEEFIIAMPRTELPEAVAAGERLRQQVVLRSPVSISVGCAERARGEAADEVIRRADDLLREAKRNGKNAVRSAALAA